MQQDLAVFLANRMHVNSSISDTALQIRPNHVVLGKPTPDHTPAPDNDLHNAPPRSTGPNLSNDIGNSEILSRLLASSLKYLNSLQHPTSEHVQPRPQHTAVYSSSPDQLTVHLRSTPSNTSVFFGNQSMWSSSAATDDFRSFIRK